MKFPTDKTPPWSTQRWIAVVVVVLLVIVGFGWVMAAGPSTQIQTFAALSAGDEDAIRGHAQAILDILDGSTTTSTPTTAPSSTTTAATSTTTSTQPTTTTQAPTTTTQPPTTTTTGPLPSPTGDNYDFFVNVLGVGRTWTAPYYYNLPYTPNTGWADGNRDGYKCAYGILLWNDEPVGRVTFSRVSGAATYTIINDKGMPDRGDTLRHYDTGSLFPRPVTQGECPPPIEAYEPSTDPGQRPVIEYLGPEGQLLERRDYRNVTIEDPRLKFRLSSVTAEQVTVIAYWENNPFVIVYYSAPFGAEGVTMHGYVP